VRERLGIFWFLGLGSGLEQFAGVLRKRPRRAGNSEIYIFYQWTAERTTDVRPKELTLIVSRRRLQIFTNFNIIVLAPLSHRESCCAALDKDMPNTGNIL